MGSEVERLRSAAERMVWLVVARPDKARVWVADICGGLEGNFVALHVDVDAEDVGRVIGARGATAKAMRTLLDLAARRMGLRYELVLPHGGKE